MAGPSLWGVGWWCRGFFDNDSEQLFFAVDVSFVFCQGMWLSFPRMCGLWVVGVGVLFSMESLILAQDERWRRA